jgi:hypothetical protein
MRRAPSGRRSTARISSAEINPASWPQTVRQVDSDVRFSFLTLRGSGLIAAELYLPLDHLPRLPDGLPAFVAPHLNDVQ